MDKIFPVSDQVVKAAWLFYVAGYRHEEVAKFLGVSRPEIGRILAGARHSGAVSVCIQHRLARYAEVEEILRCKYKLKFCRVAPLASTDPYQDKDGPVDGRRCAEQSASARRAVGSVAAEFLGKKLRRDKHCIVGAGWGRTISQIPAHLASIITPAARFVSVLGSLTRTHAINPLDGVLPLARSTGGEGYLLPVPFIADTAAGRRALMSQIGYQETMALAKKATLYLVSLGNCDQQSPVFEQRHLSSSELSSLRRAGAVCHFLGKFFDAQGRMVNHEINERILAMDLNCIQNRETIALCAGQEKLAGVWGLLEAGIIDRLIIDGGTAMRLGRK